jgi:hypothetical protein
MIELIVGGGLLLVAASLYAAYRLRQKNKALIDALEKAAKQKEEEANSYNLPSQDDELVEQCKQMLDAEYPLGVVETMKQMDLEERKRCMINIASKASGIMKVSPVEIRFDEYPCCSGSYSNEDDTISFSLAFLMNDDDIAVCVNTVFHELRHKLQYHSIKDGNPRGYEQSLIKKWASEYNEYISPYLSPRLYYHQIIETDARLFADRIIKYKKN